MQKREGEKPTKFATKEMRAQDAALAMKEYQAERLAMSSQWAWRFSRIALTRRSRSP